MLREGHQKRLQSASLSCVPGSVWASRVPPGSPGDCSLELTSELSPEQQMCSLSGGGADGLGKGASQGSRATKQGAVPSSQARLFLPISQEIALKPGETGVQEGGEQRQPACYSPTVNGQGLKHSAPTQILPSVTPQAKVAITSLVGGGVLSRADHIMGRTHTHTKIPMSQPLLCARIYLGFWIFSAFNDCLFFLGLWLLLSPASQLLGCPF